VTTANVSGTANISTLVVTANASVAGNVAVTGNVVVTGNVTSATHILTGGTANGVVYLDTTKALTTGSALTFDGTTFSNSTSGTPLSLNRTGSATALIELKQSGTVGGYIGTTGANNFTFYNASASDLITLNNTGLGIGTSSPTKKLEVQSSTSGGQQARFIDTSGVGGGGRGGGISMGGVSNDTGPVYTDYGRILALKTNATQGNTQGFLLFQVNDGSAQASAMSISSARVVTMDGYGVGTATFSAAGVISSVSDETWKIKDGVPVDPDAMLKKLEPGYWFYNDEKKEIFGADRQLGFYAQNVNAAIGPEAAPTPEEGKPWGYYDRSVLAVTVMSLQKALATIETLTARITALEGA
jgi:hypothetical protein